MAANPAVSGDVEARFRTMTEAEHKLAGVLLDDAWLDVTTRLPTAGARLEAGTLDSALVVSVLARMVVRVMRNPDGLREVSIDDFRQVRDETLSAGLLYPMPDELQLLAGGAGRSTGSVRLVAHGDLGY